MARLPISTLFGLTMFTTLTLFGIPVAAIAQQATVAGHLDVGRLAEDARAEQEGSYPRFTWGIAAEVEYDDTFSSTDPDAEFHDFFPTVEGAFALEILEGTGLFSTVVLEPVEDPVKDRSFRDIGLYAEELYAQATFGQIALKGGKFNPAFGSAWDTAPGIFGTSFAEDYELTERVGGSMSYGFDALGGEHTLQGAFFLADRSILSNSAFTERGELSLSDGGPSNTRSPQSFSLALDGAFGGLGYNTGFRYQEGGRDTPDDEIGLVAGLTYEGIEAGPGKLSLLGEGAYFANAESGPDDAVYLTFGGAYALDPFSLSAVYGMRDVEDDGTRDHLATTSLEAEIFDGLVAAIGYGYTREAGESAHTVGVLFAFEFGGSVP